MKHQSNVLLKSWWFILSEKYTKKNGINVGVEWPHFPFKLIFLLLRVNNRLGRGMEGANDRLGGARGNALPWYDSGVFLEFHYLIISINSLLYNSNLRYSETSPAVWFKGYFWNFMTWKISINTLLCNPNLKYSESLNPYFRGCRQIGQIMLNRCVFI